MIEILANGVPYTDFVSASVTVSLDSLANEFEFTASAVDGFPPFGQDEEISVLVDGVVVLTGPISLVSGSDSEGSHTVTYGGRDKTGDFIDSQIDVIGDIDGDITLKQLIEIIADDVGSDVQVIDNFDPDPFNAAEDIIKPQPGDNAYEFVLEYARKRQALLTSDGEGNIVITQSSPLDSGESLQRLVKSDANNVIAHSWELDNDLRFNKYVFRGQLDPLGANLAGDTDIAAVENQSGVVFDDEVRPGRQKVVVESEGYSAYQLTDRAKWSKQIGKAQATRLSFSVKGHSKRSGGVWEVNELVQANSELADVNRKMLIDTLIFLEAEGEATQTSINVVEKNVYTINERVLSQKPAGRQLDEFKGLI